MSATFPSDISLFTSHCRSFDCYCVHQSRGKPFPFRFLSVPFGCSFPKLDAGAAAEKSRKNHAGWIVSGGWPDFVPFRSWAPVMVVAAVMQITSLKIHYKIPLRSFDAEIFAYAEFRVLKQLREIESMSAWIMQIRADGKRFLSQPATLSGLLSNWKWIIQIQVQNNLKLEETWRDSVLLISQLTLYSNLSPSENKRPQFPTIIHLWKIITAYLISQNSYCEFCSTLHVNLDRLRL